MQNLNESKQIILEILREKRNELEYILYSNSPICIAVSQETIEDFRKKQFIRLEAINWGIQQILSLS